MNSYCYIYLSLLCMFCSTYSVSLCCSMYYFCVNVCCTSATGCQPSCSQQIYQSYVIRTLPVFFYFYVTVHRNNLFLIKPTDAPIYQIYFVKKIYMFRAVPLPIIRSLPLYLRHWYMSCRLYDSFQARLDCP